MSQKINIIPAIDLIDGQCVRLTKGDYDQKTVYSKKPLTFAMEFEVLGYERLHLVDLSGAKSGDTPNLNVLRDIARQTDLKIDYSGGIRSVSQVEQVLELGASFVTIGSWFLNDVPTFFQEIKSVNPEQLIVALDVNDGKVMKNGWINDSGLEFDELVEQLLANGINQIMSTDISKDGMMMGPAVEWYQRIIEKFPEVQWIASGGVRDSQDLIALEKIQIKEVIVGKALLENPLLFNRKEEIWD